MKTKYITFLLALFFLQQNSIANNSQLKGQISISGAFALYPLVVKWSEEFRKIHPNVRIDISGGGAGKGMTDALSGMADLAMVSRDVFKEEFNNGAFVITVAKDAVVPVINIKNPYYNLLIKRGLKQQEAIDIFISGKTKTWGQLLKTNSKAPLRAYTRSDACGAAETWAKYLRNKKQEDLLGTAVFGDPGIASVVMKDAVAIGYNNIAYAYNLRTKKPHKGIAILPLDLNNNGRIDPEENFYDTIDLLITAIANGVYPNPPARDLFLVSKGKPTKPIVKAFIKFILTEGQKHNVPNGFVKLPDNRLQTELNKIK